MIACKKQPYMEYEAPLEQDWSQTTPARLKSISTPVFLWSRDSASVGGSRHGGNGSSNRAEILDDRRQELLARTFIQVKANLVGHEKIIILHQFFQDVTHSLWVIQEYQALSKRKNRKKKIEDIRYFIMRKQHYPRPHSNTLICCFHRTPLQRKKTFLSFIEDNRKLRRKTRLVLLDTEISKAHWRSHFVGMSQLKWNRHNTEPCMWHTKTGKDLRVSEYFTTGCLNTFRQRLTKKPKHWKCSCEE